MNNEIKIIDNFLSEEEMDFIQDYLETAKWSIQCIYPGSLEFLMCNVTEVDYFKNYLYAYSFQECPMRITLAYKLL